MNEFGCDSRFITAWKTRFASERLAGQYGRHRGRAPRRDLARPEARVHVTRLDVSRGTARPTGAVASSPRSWACAHDGATHLAQARYPSSSTRHPHGVRRS